MDQPSRRQLHLQRQRQRQLLRLRLRLRLLHSNAKTCSDHHANAYTSSDANAHSVDKLPADVSDLAADDISSLTTDAVSEPTANQVSDLSPSAVQGFSADQVSELSDNAVAAFSANQVKQLATDAAAGLTKSQVSELTPKSVERVHISRADGRASQKHLQGTGNSATGETQQGCGHGSDQRTAENAERCEISAFKPGKIKSLDADAISGFKPSTLDDFSRRQIKALTDDQLAGLSRRQIKKADDFVDAPPLSSVPRSPSIPVGPTGSRIHSQTRTTCSCCLDSTPSPDPHPSLIAGLLKNQTRQKKSRGHMASFD